MASRLEAIAYRLETIASRLEAIAGRLEAIVGWKPLLVGWKPWRLFQQITAEAGGCDLNFKQGDVVPGHRTPSWLIERPRIHLLLYSVLCRTFKHTLQ